MKIEDMLAEKLFNGAVFYNNSSDVTYRMVDGKMQARTTTHGWKSTEIEIEYLARRINDLIEVKHDVESGEYIKIKRDVLGKEQTILFLVSFVRGNKLTGYRQGSSNSGSFISFNLLEDRLTYRRMTEKEIKDVKVARQFGFKNRKAYEFKVGDIVAYNECNMGLVAEINEDEVTVELIYGGTVDTHKENLMIKFWVEDEVKFY